MKHDACPDCGVPVGRKHNAVPIADTRRSGALGSIRTIRAVRCGMANGRARRIPNDVGGNRSFPDLNGLFRECVWNPDQQRWEQPTRSDGKTLH